MDFIVDKATDAKRDHGHKNTLWPITYCIVSPLSKGRFHRLGLS